MASAASAHPRRRPPSVPVDRPFWIRSASRDHPGRRYAGPGEENLIQETLPRDAIEAAAAREALSQLPLGLARELDPKHENAKVVTITGEIPESTGSRRPARCPTGRRADRI